MTEAVMILVPIKFSKVKKDEIFFVRRSEDDLVYFRRDHPIFKCSQDCCKNVTFLWRVFDFVAFRDDDQVFVYRWSKKEEEK